MHYKQEIINEALIKLNPPSDYKTNTVQIPVTLLAPNYSFYSYKVVFEKDIKTQQGGWIPKEIIKE
jgi:hypothetical protein